MKNGRIISALPLSREEIDQIALAFSSVEGEEYSFETMVDSGLIGGVIVETEGRIYDSSIKRKLESIKASLLQSGAEHGQKEE